MQIITGIGESEHVTSMQHRAIFEMVIGDNSYILNKGELLEPELQSNNALKIRSGMLAHHGCISEVAPNTYDEVAIGNGSQSMKRIDLVVARYTQNAETKVERTEWTVIQGQPVESNPVAPDYIHGNMQDGDLTDDCPVFEVHLDGIQVVEIKKLLNVLDGSLAELNRKLILYEWETTVKPFASINPGNKLTFTVRKIGRVCTGNILWVGSVSGTNATLTDFTIPEPFRPIKTEYYSASLISSGKVFGSSRLDISNLGKVTYATDQEGFVERYVSFSYIGNDITPDEMYLVDNL